MTVVVGAGPYGEPLAAFMQASAPGETFVVSDGTEQAGLDADVVVTFLNEPDALPRLLGPNVRWVHVLAAGVDRFPFDALGDRVLTCSRGAASGPIAEWVLATMLAFEKQIPQSFLSEPPPQWNIASLGGLEGKTLGLVGLGEIALAVALRSLAFGMSAVAYRRTGASSPLANVEVASDIATVLGRADHLVIAAPATPATRHILGAEALARCQKGVHVVNVSRGSLVDQDALREALDDGTVACASLDTVEPEPLPAGHWMFDHPKVRLSAHVSWSSPVTIPRTVQLFLENLASYRSGRPLTGLVDIEAGY